jgi:hypothetical protein
MKTPVVLIIFNRPKLTELVFDALARARPRTLLVVADGPRPDVPGDLQGCEEARAVITRVNWKCDVIKNYSDVNLGCGRRPATGISWALEQAEEAIILEDDCVPHPSFFPFCEELLERYRDDERVMHIAGSTYRRHALPTRHSYVFSRLIGGWGWATWRRAWRHFDASLTLWPQLRATPWLLDLLKYESAARYFAHEFEAAYERQGNVTYWDHQWTFACWAQSGLSITPRVNLITNTGCGPGATHMHGRDDPMGNLPAYEIGFPLAHPPVVLPSMEADEEFLREVWLPRLWTPSAMRQVASRVVPDALKPAFRRVAAALGPLSR